MLGCALSSQSRVEGDKEVQKRSIKDYKENYNNNSSCFLSELITPIILLSFWIFIFSLNK